MPDFMAMLQEGRNKTADLAEGLYRISRMRGYAGAVMGGTHARFNPKEIFEGADSAMQMLKNIMTEGGFVDYGRGINREYMPGESDKPDEGTLGSPTGIKAGGL